MSIHLMSVMALADVLGYTLVRSTKKRRLPLGGNRYCIVSVELGREELHNVQLKRVQVFLCREAEIAVGLRGGSSPS